MSFVEIKNVTKQFALHNISASIPKGKLVGLVGPDGAGKTTLLRLIAGLLTPSQGSISVDGYDTIVDGEPIHALTGYMPQRFGLYDDLSVQQNLNLYADLRGVAVDERLLQFTGLKEFTTRLAKNLSGGMRQKLGLACALVKKPSLLLLDEPTVGVDPISRRELWKMVTQLLQDDISVIWSTAYLDEAEQCDTVLLINEGKLLYSGDPKVVTQQMEGRVFRVGEPAGDRRQLLFKLLNDPAVIDGVIQGRDVRFVVGQEKSPPIAAEPTTPRFEDAFINILGGGPGGRSELADRAPTISDANDHTIVADRLTKKFGSFVAAHDITLSVKKGEVFGLLGPNGAGKTTTFKMLCGLLKPTSGSAVVNGVDLQKAPGVARARIGYMAQKFSLYGNLSVRQNLDFFAGIYNLKNRHRRDAIDEMVEVFQLHDYLDQSAELMPLGFKQRLSLACANMHHPEVLFLDEPTSGVDPITRRQFWNHINGLVQKGVTIMITTHFMDEAEYCDRIGLVYRGEMVRVGTPNELKGVVKTHDNPTLEEAFIYLIEEENGRT